MRAASLQPVALNTFWLFLSRITSQGLGLVFTVLVARSLGAAGLGQFAFITTVVFLGNVLTTFGLDTLLIREVSASRRTDIFTIPAALWIQLVLSVLFIAAVSIGAGRLTHQAPDTLLALEIYSLSLIPLAFYTVYSAIVRAYERMDLFFRINLVTSGVLTIAGAGILLGGGNLVSLAWVMLANQCLSAIGAALICIRGLRGVTIRWRIPIARLSEVLRLGSPLAALSGVAVVYQRMGILLLVALSTDAATGWFSAAARITEGLKIFHFALLGALFPLLSRLASNGAKPELDVDAPTGLLMTRPAVRYSRQSFEVLLVFGLSMALLLTFLSGPLINFLYGERYAPSAQVLSILAWGLVPYAYSAQVSMELVAGSREKLVMSGSALATLIAAILYLALIPSLGAIGAALAAVFGETFQAAIFWFLARNTL